jgi:hypothetical protein
VTKNACAGVPHHERLRRPVQYSVFLCELIPQERAEMVTNSTPVILHTKTSAVRAAGPACRQQRHNEQLFDGRAKVYAGPAAARSWCDKTHRESDFLCAFHPRSRTRPRTRHPHPSPSPVVRHPTPVASPHPSPVTLTVSEQWRSAPPREPAHPRVFTPKNRELDWHPSPVVVTRRSSPVAPSPVPLVRHPSPVVRHRPSPNFVPSKKKLDTFGKMC